MNEQGNRPKKRNTNNSSNKVNVRRVSKRPEDRSQTADFHNAREAAQRENSRQRVRRSRARQRLFYGLILILVISITVVLSLTVFFHIDTIEVKGNSRYASEIIIERSGIKMNDNLFLSNMKKAEELLVRELPYISSVKAERIFPSTALITVEETDASFALDDGGYVLIDDNKKVLENNSTDIQGEIPVITGLTLLNKNPGETLTVDGYDMEDLLNRIIDGIVKSGLNGSMVIDLTNHVDIRINYQNRLTLIFGSPVDIEYKFSFAKITVDEKLPSDVTGSVDFTIPKKAVYSSSGAPGETITYNDETTENGAATTVTENVSTME